MAAYGGVQNYMWRLWEMLADQFKDIDEPPRGFCLKGKTAELVRWPNPTTIRPVGANGSRLKFIQMTLSAPRANECVVVGHINLAPLALLAKLVGRIKSYVVVLHGIEAWKRASFLKRQSLKYAHAVIGTTRYTALTCAQVNNLAGDNFRVISLCAEQTPAAPDPDFKLAGQWPLLFVGRLATSEKYKGLETTMEAVAVIQRESSPVVLYVAGDGDDRTRLEALAESLTTKGKIIFLGLLSDAQLQSAYNSAKVFVMPSAKEGFGIVFLEAMRRGVPCIGGAHGGTPEVFEDNREGLLVPYGDSEALADQLRLLVNDKQMADRLSAASRRRFEKDYTFDRFSERWRHALVADSYV